jgi:hypothetical protein
LVKAQVAVLDLHNKAEVLEAQVVIMEQLRVPLMVVVAVAVAMVVVVAVLPTVLE